MCKCENHASSVPEDYIDMPVTLKEVEALQTAVVLALTFLEGTPIGHTLGDILESMPAVTDFD